MNYQNKKFRPISNTNNGEVTSSMIFHYKQEGNIITCAYTGENIITGHLIGLVDDDGNIDMRYHQINHQGQLRTGICYSKPELLKNGKIRLYESWQWTSGDKSRGESVIEEI